MTGDDSGHRPSVADVAQWQPPDLCHDRHRSVQIVSPPGLGSQRTQIRRAQRRHRLHMMQRQLRALQGLGFMVQHTFIDEMPSRIPTRRRPHSAPPAKLSSSSSAPGKSCSMPQVEAALVIQRFCRRFVVGKSKAKFADDDATQQLHTLDVQQALSRIAPSTSAINTEPSRT